jgi:endonuclease/exonuclease/phosphatase family metal-dependent hydrolase
MADGLGAKGQRAIDDHALLNRIAAQAVYSQSDQARLIALARRYGFAALSPPSNALVRLRSIRGRLFSRSESGVVTVAAAGRSSWTGWFELRRDDVRWTATRNTARVIAQVRPDILICVEVEDRPTLLRFNAQVLGPEYGLDYAHAMVIDGNDDRGIDVGVLSRYPIRSVRSHVDDLGPTGSRVFSRDCPEYLVDLPGGRSLVVMPSHFKSKRGGNDDKVRERRLLQAQRTAEIARDALRTRSLVLVGGDLNDTPDSAELAPLFADGFVDVQSHPSWPSDRPGTYDTGTAANKIDYLILSPRLRAALAGTGIERRGSYHPLSWEPFDTVKSAADEASDHHLVWADFDL